MDTQYETMLKQQICKCISLGYLLNDEVVKMLLRNLATIKRLRINWIKAKLCNDY